MTRHTALLFLISILSGASCFHAQQKSNQERLAIQFLEQKEYDKANVFLEDLYDKNSDAWYTPYFKSLVAAKEFDKAEKITRRQLRRDRNASHLYVNLGQVQSLEGNEKKARDDYERAIKEMIPVQPHIQNVANSFTALGLYDYAIEVYDKARKENRDYPYFYERAEIFKAKNDLRAMVGEYLDALEYRDSELGTVQSHLLNSLGYDDESGGLKNPLLKEELQKRIQKHPEKQVLSEFLIFVQEQQQDFEGAFVQSRALDKRLHEDGQRVFALVRMSAANEAYDVAQKCFDYIVSLGTKNPFYDAALLESLQLKYDQLTRQAQPSRQSLEQLEKQLVSALERYNTGTQSVMLLQDLARLRAFYLGKMDEAAGLLQAEIARPGVDAASLAQVKLLLGDIYLASGNIWDASLLYSQVEKAFKFEPVGHEAKFRNAKLSFYAGDFKWAKAQCDVLKGSTEKLIANDALDLSLVISDAIGVDTNEAPLRMFASASLLIAQHRFDDAVERMDSINLLYPSNTLGDDILFKKAAVYKSLHRFTDAEAALQNIISYYPDGLYGDDAQFMLAELYERSMNDRTRAQNAYEELLTKYPGSVFTVEARKRFRQLRGDELRN